MSVNRLSDSLDATLTTTFHQPQQNKRDSLSQTSREKKIKEWNSNVFNLEDRDEVPLFHRKKKSTSSNSCSTFDDFRVLQHNNSGSINIIVDNNTSAKF